MPITRPNRIVRRHAVQGKVLFAFEGSPELMEQLLDLAYAEHTSRTAILVKALTEYVERAHQKGELNGPAAKHDG